MIERLIRKLERFEPVRAAERAFLEQSIARVSEYDPHACFVNEGDSPTESCLMVEGFAGRIKTLPSGTRQMMALHIPGDFCDLHSFSLRKMDHSIAAVSRCKIAKVPHAKIAEIIERFPRLTRALFWDVAVDAAILREWMVSAGRRSAYQKIAHLLCEMLLRLRSVALVEGDSYSFPLTQAELGEAFGLSTVHVNRTLQVLRREDLLVWKGKTVTIPDANALAKAAGFDPSYLALR
jgi:CRP-like cAMP-binding protein